MIPLTLEKIATIVGGKAYGDATQVITSAPVFDSRSAVKGSLFLALVGDNSDGHDYVSDAKAHGATGFLTTKEVQGDGVVVSDVLLAVRTLAAYVRKEVAQILKFSKLTETLKKMIMIMNRQTMKVFLPSWNL